MNGTAPRPATGLLDRLAIVLASALGAGFMPIAPGTFGTLTAIPLFYLTAAWPLASRLLFTALVALGAMAVAHRAGRAFGDAFDDQRIVIDEVAGYLLTVCLSPWSWKAAAVGFVFFRVFDISKPWPARYFDRQTKSGFGNVMDDLCAGGFALGCTHLVLSLWS